TTPLWACAVKVGVVMVMFYMFLSRPGGMVESKGVSRQPDRQGRVRGSFGIDKQEPEAIRQETGR
ncbi:MAG: hypothetical protein ACYDEY_15560, partial [Acidimicrobiales bacterium]